MLLLVIAVWTLREFAAKVGSIAERNLVMGQAKPFARIEAFDPETLEKLTRAFELAIANLHDTGQPDSVRELIADRIMQSARKGERDVHALWRAALRGIVLPY